MNRCENRNDENIVFHRIIGENIQKLRVKKKMTREEVANGAGISTKFLYEIEKGKKGISAYSLQKIAGALSCSSDAILNGTDVDVLEQLLKLTKKETLNHLTERQKQIMQEILGLMLELLEE